MLEKTVEELAVKTKKSTELEYALQYHNKKRSQLIRAVINSVSAVMKVADLKDIKGTMWDQGCYLGQVDQLNRPAGTGIFLTKSSKFQCSSMGVSTIATQFSCRDTMKTKQKPSKIYV